MESRTGRLSDSLGPKSRNAHPTGVHQSKGLRSEKDSAGRPVSRGLKAEDVEEIEMRLRREFDLETKFGPTSGLTRLERFHRAVKLGLDPPEWVEEIVEKHGIDSDLNKHVFAPGKI